MYYLPPVNDTDLTVATERQPDCYEEAKLHVNAALRADATLIEAARAATRNGMLRKLLGTALDDPTTINGITRGDFMARNEIHPKRISGITSAMCAAAKGTPVTIRIDFAPHGQAHNDRWFIDVPGSNYSNGAKSTDERKKVDGLIRFAKECTEGAGDMAPDSAYLLQVLATGLLGRWKKTLDGVFARSVGTLVEEVNQSVNGRGCVVLVRNGLIFVSLYPDTIRIVNSGEAREHLFDELRPPSPAPRLHIDSSVLLPLPSPPVAERKKPKKDANGGDDDDTALEVAEINNEALQRRVLELTALLRAAAKYLDTMEGEIAMLRAQRPPNEEHDEQIEDMRWVIDELQRRAEAAEFDRGLYEGRNSQLEQEVIALREELHPGTAVEDAHPEVAPLSATDNIAQRINEHKEEIVAQPNGALHVAILESLLGSRRMSVMPTAAAITMEVADEHSDQKEGDISAILNYALRSKLHEMGMRIDNKRIWRSGESTTVYTLRLENEAAVEAEADPAQKEDRKYAPRRRGGIKAAQPPGIHPTSAPDPLFARPNRGQIAPAEAAERIFNAETTEDLRACFGTLIAELSDNRGNVPLLSVRDLADELSGKVDTYPASANMRQHTRTIISWLRRVIAATSPGDSTISSKHRNLLISSIF